MIAFTYKSPKFSEKETRRYVRMGGKDSFDWCAQSIKEPQFDFAQGTCEISDLPPEILAKCLEHGTKYFYACEWPW